MLQVAVVAAVVGVEADPVAGRPLRGDVAEHMQAVLVFRGQVVDVGAVFAEAFGDAEVGAQQGGVEAPVERFDVAVAPQAVVAAQALAAEAQFLAGVGGEAGVADPEFAQRQVALVRLAGVVAAGVVAEVVGLQGVGLDDVGGGHRLAHGEGAPVAALEVAPGAQVETQAVDVAAVPGAEVAVVLGLGGDLHVQADAVVGHLHRPGRRAAQQRQGEPVVSFDGEHGGVLHGCRAAVRVSAPGAAPR
ncbi:hypothetical protein D9M70_356810 [compost metagenome]